MPELQNKDIQKMILDLERQYNEIRWNNILSFFTGYCCGSLTVVFLVLIWYLTYHHG